MGRGSAPSGASKDERPGCLDTLAATPGPSPFEARRRGSHLRVTVMECARRFSIVFASVAKQSRIFPRRQYGLLRCARNDGASGEAIALQFTSQTAGTSSRSRGACRPSFASSIALIETRAQGRPGAGWHPQSVRHKKMHTGWTTGFAGSPGLPCANGFNGVLRALLGERCTIAPVASRLADVRVRSGSAHHRKA